MNPLWSVIIGGALTLLGSLLGGFLTNLFTLRKERQQWERQQQAERDKLRHAEEKQAREQLRETYTNCARSLTQYIYVPYPEVLGTYEGEEAFDKLTVNKKELYYADKRRYDTERAKHYVEAQYWLPLLRVNLHSVSKADQDEFDKQFQEFIEDRTTADELRALVLKFMRDDPRLISHELPPH